MNVFNNNGYLSGKQMFIVKTIEHDNIYIYIYI